MRVFVVGATGAIGTRLVPQLIEHGHEVIGTHRSPGNADRVRALGAEPVALDLLDAGAVRRAVLDAKPDAIVHQATALAGVRFGRSLDRSFGPTNRLRTEGTDALLAAAREAGVGRFVAQSFASYRYAREGGPVKTENDRLDPDPPAMARETNAAMRHLDEAVTSAGSHSDIGAGSSSVMLYSPAPSWPSASTVAAAASSRWMNEEMPPPAPMTGNCRLRTGLTSPSLAAP